MIFLEKLRQDLFDIRITKYFDKHIYMLHKPEKYKTNKYIEYELIRNTEEDFAGNKNLTEDNTIQIDIISNVLPVDEFEVVKSVMKEKGYTYINSNTSYENDVQLYMYSSRWKIKKILIRGGNDARR